MTAGNILINFMAIGMALIFAIIFVLILIKGEEKLIEPRRWVALIEFVLMSAIIALALYNLWEGICH